MVCSSLYQRPPIRIFLKTTRPKGGSAVPGSSPETVSGNDRLDGEAVALGVRVAPEVVFVVVETGAGEGQPLAVAPADPLQDEGGASEQVLLGVGWAHAVAEAREDPRVHEGARHGLLVRKEACGR